MVKKLVRKNRHMGPMYAVLSRYGIGSDDQYGRGLWISAADLAAIGECMATDSSKVTGPDWIAVRGTNIHNHVMFSDFSELFSENPS